MILNILLSWKVLKTYIYSLAKDIPCYLVLYWQKSYSKSLCLIVKIKDNTFHFLQSVKK